MRGCVPDYVQFNTYPPLSHQLNPIRTTIPTKVPIGDNRQGEMKIKYLFGCTIEKRERKKTHTRVRYKILLQNAVAVVCWTGVGKEGENTPEYEKAKIDYYI